MPVLSEATGALWLSHKEIIQFKWHVSDSHTAENEMLQSTMCSCKKESLWQVNSCNLSILYHPPRKMARRRENSVCFLMQKLRCLF